MTYPSFFALFGATQGFLLAAVLPVFRTVARESRGPVTSSSYGVWSQPVTSNEEIARIVIVALRLM